MAKLSSANHGTQGNKEKKQQKGADQKERKEGRKEGRKDGRKEGRKKALTCQILTTVRGCCVLVTSGVPLCHVNAVHNAIQLVLAGLQHIMQPPAAFWRGDLPCIPLQPAFPGLISLIAMLLQVLACRDPLVWRHTAGWALIDSGRM